MPESVTCELCGVLLQPNAFYVVRIDVFADPSMPPISTEDPTNDPATDIVELMKQIESMTEDQLQDQVHRRFEYRLCPRCHARFLLNPLGKPRGTKPGRN